jgi:hypothetical protein
MKHGYSCTCGWTLNRGQLTRREYALAKETHAAQGCESLQKELKRSGKL